ncbi:MAG: glycosyltransferase family 2 protein [Bacteroidales bacterium]|jgi:glycosyltransferase involved in cell wall biosynthesis|nr:glycosyltransferase family 2 protein [Bacteroidales bacterium]
MHTNNPLFSVLIANYNNAKYIAQTIESVFAQTYSHWEIIILDDASTDNSWEVINRYSSNPQIKIFKNQTNRKCGYTKRKLIELSSGDLFGFVDSDDTISPNALEVMVDVHRNKPAVGLVYSQSYDCDEDLTIIAPTNYQKQIPKRTTYLEYGGYSVFPFISIKRDFYNKTEGINSKFHIAEDQDLYYKMEEVSTFFFIEQSLYYRRLNTGNHISIGENEKMSLMYHMVAKADAYERRNKEFDSLIIKEFNIWLDYYTRETEKKAIKSFKNTSKELVWGNRLLHPLSTFKYFFKRKFN